jgi:opacity protein-like surface antigen
MIRWFCVLLLALASLQLAAQLPDLKDFPKKGSYLYFNQPAFEDNSFLLSEAINQEKGVMQYVSNLYFDNLRGGNFLYNFTHQIPLGGEKHQVSYTLFYYLQNEHATSGGGGGFGDINLTYQYMLTGKKSWAMVVPSFTVIIPTGKNGYGSGGLGGEADIFITKRISRRVVTHYNFGYTFISNADHYISTVTGSQEVGFERDLQYKKIAASVIWYPVRKFNVMLEYVSNFLTDINADGTLSATHQTTVNPGLRFAIDYKRVQIVPGISAPVIFSGETYSHTGLFFYLSFEPEYLPFTKMKHR